MKIKTGKKGTVKTETNVTFNWDGVSPEQKLQLQTRAATIAWQAEVRGNVPTGDVTVNVAELLVRKARGPIDIVKVVSNMGNEDRAALIARLQAMG